MSQKDQNPDFQSDIEKWIEKQPSAQGEVNLSIVIPAYNEQWRLPPTLIDMIDYLDVKGDLYEIIVVDDGSRDSTSEVVKKFERIRSQVKLIRLPRNQGKGHAVRVGVLNAHGQEVLFADADGSTPIGELERLRKALAQGAEIAFGSRALSSKETQVHTRWYRKYLGRAFNFCVNKILLPDVADTQCGFKLFTAKAANFLFSRQKSDGFSFDVEILYLARLVGMKMVEVPINWSNVPGSKVNLVVDACKMFKDILIFPVRHRGVGE